MASTFDSLRTGEKANKAKIPPQPSATNSDHRMPSVNHRGAKACRAALLVKPPGSSKRAAA
eukprot:CAMPEP_0203883484 /NCGR_PEP_ID=MMETSP0359-20131031/27596_1 /ASSEMBLY_ACC=CAM_ASM_000338 /TAXON_ID=268821 /ORGANISM="Scrippsiella Hangoei, Strain SHTV-5" /LENGTH=60 /DNA_ID=CAMNT_0050803733 /DNA_START=127 /DNA_END=306 /DNA_ORIENTATION=+